MAEVSIETTKSLTVESVAAPAGGPIDSTVSAASAPAWQLPVYDFASGPAAAARATARSNSKFGEKNFFRTAQWSADGQTILTHAEDRTYRLFQLPPDLLRSTLTLTPFLASPQPAPILSAAFHPFGSTSLPGSLCFASAVRDQPVHLLDGVTGAVRATYPLEDHRERFVAPADMVFDWAGEKIYCATESAIDVFDVHAPGEAPTHVPLTPSRKSRSGQKGIISSLSFSPDYSGLLAAGSFSRSVGLYTVQKSGAEPHILITHLDAGVTQVRFPTPETLLIAMRNSLHMLLYDLRDVSQPLATLPRAGRTNQRLGFSISPDGRCVSTGGTDGSVSVFDLQTVPSDGTEAAPSFTFQASTDTVSTASFHPSLPLLLTTSGSRHFPSPTSSATSVASDGEEEVEVERITLGPLPSDGEGLQVWKIGDLHGDLQSGAGVYPVSNETVDVRG